MTNLVANEEAVRAWLTGHLASVLKRPAEKIGADVQFPALGLDSAEMLFLVSAIEDWTGLEFESDVPLDHPTVSALSRYIAARLAAARG